MNKASKYILLIITAITLPILIYLLFDNLPRYLSWQSLSTDKIETKAKIYSGGIPACLYVVECSSGNPKLKLVENIGDLDVVELKELIWRRRFYKYCEGSTENIVLDYPSRIKLSENISDARWSFYNDRFVTNNGHFQGSYVSQFQWETCTKSKVLWGKKSEDNNAPN